MLLLVGGLIVYFIPSMFKYFSQNTLKKLLVTGAWMVNSIAVLFCAGFIRSLFVIEESDSESIFRAGGNLDQMYNWFAFGLAIIIIALLFSFYQKNFPGRFMLISSLQIIIISVSYIIQLIKENNLQGQPMMIVFTALVIGIGLFVRAKKRNEESLKELFFTLFGKLFEV